MLKPTTTSIHLYYSKRIQVPSGSLEKLTRVMTDYLDLRLVPPCTQDVLLNQKTFVEACKVTKFSKDHYHIEIIQVTGSVTSSHKLSMHLNSITLSSLSSSVRKPLERYLSRTKLRT